MGAIKKGSEWLDNRLLNLLCCIAGDNISQSGNTDTITYHEKLANEVTLLHTNLTLRNCINDNLLQISIILFLLETNHFIGGKFPLLLKLLIENLSNKEATKTYQKSYTDKRKPKVINDDDGNTVIDPTLQNSINYCFLVKNLKQFLTNLELNLTRLMIDGYLLSNLKVEGIVTDCISVSKNYISTFYTGINFILFYIL